MESNNKIVVVSSDNKEFIASQESLSQHSEFFRGLFDSGMKECSAKCIPLPTLSSRGLELAFGFMQGTKPRCTLETFPDVLEVCTFLQMADLMVYCEQLFDELLTCENCLSLCDIADMFLLTHLKAKAYNYMLENFKTVMEKNEDLYDLPLDRMSELLDGDIQVDKEVSVFNAAFQWLSKKACLHDLKSAETIFASVRFPLMGLDELNQCLTLLKSVSMDQTCKVYASIEIATELLADPTAILKKETGRASELRAAEDVLLTLGGFSSSNRSTNRMMLITTKDICDNTAETIPLKSQTASRTSIRLPRALCEHGVVQVGAFVYIAGGQSQYCQDGRHTRLDVHRFDTRTCKWTEVASMASPRSLFYLGHIGDYLYAVGGWVAPDKVSRSVERYNIHEDHWERVSCLTIGLHEHAGSRFKGSLYISGGFKGPYRGHLDRVWRYNPDEDLWTECRPMSYSRSYHCMETVGEHILVVGGVNYIGEDAFEDVLACERYNPVADQWTTISQLPRFASCMSHCLLNNQLFVFGGHSFQGDTIHNNALIYNVETNEWTEKAMLKDNISFFPCCLVKLSKTVISRFVR